MRRLAAENLSPKPPQRILLVCGITHVSRGLENLLAVIRYRLHADPLGGDLFVFCGTGYKTLVTLEWDGGGLRIAKRRVDVGADHIADSRLAAFFRLLQISAATRLPRLGDDREPVFTAQTVGLCPQVLEIHRVIVVELFAVNVRQCKTPEVSQSPEGVIRNSVYGGTKPPTETRSCVSIPRRGHSEFRVNLDFPTFPSVVSQSPEGVIRNSVCLKALR